MPMGIVTDTCPAPECNLTQQDIEQFVDEMTNYVELFEPVFQRTEQLEWSKVYLHGLLGDAPRKNIEQMALGLEENVRGMQHYIGQSTWKQEPVITIHQDLVAETLGETDGVALIDESGVVKQGDDSVGVAAQYCCSVGKVANSQIGVYLGYASRKGYSLVVVTQPACDRAIIKEGSKGPIVCDFAFLRIIESRSNLPGPEVWLIIRRNVDDPSVIKFYFRVPPPILP